jgi:hypothetical protein
LEPEPEPEVGADPFTDVELAPFILVALAELTAGAEVLVEAVVLAA